MAFSKTAKSGAIALVLFTVSTAAALATDDNAFFGGSLGTVSASIARDVSAAAAENSINAPELMRFYSARRFAPVWLESPANADLVQSTLMSSYSEGLDPASYHEKELAGLTGETIESRVRHELLLTDGLLKYIHDVRLGRVEPNKIDSDIELPAQRYDAVAGLLAALSGGTLHQFLAELPPPHPAYAALRDALQHYRVIAANGGWPQMPAKATDAADPRVRKVLWARLSVEDAALRKLDPGSDEAALQQALIRFQQRNGLAPDGKLGPRTLEALNVAAEARIEQIEANMERWRWLARAFEPDHIVVNVPDASLNAVHAGKIVLTSRIVVGRVRDRTPILRATVTGVTVNPPWDVPMAIARNEFLPKLRKDPAYLARHSIIIKGRGDDPSGTLVPWSAMKAKDFDFHLRQLPGTENALGRIKLEMANIYSVYLHDTPNTTVFASNDRDLSHGCMRVDRILDLASVALTGDPAGEFGTIHDMIESGVTTTLPLKQPLPVYVLYWTAFVDGDGELQFRRDLYGRDKRLFPALHTRGIEARFAEYQTCPVIRG